MQTFKTISRFVFAIFFVLGGINHFLHPDFYLKIMPPYLPWHLPLVDISGVFEIVLGGMLFFRRLAPLAAWGLILLLIAVFPANIYVYRHPDVIPAPPMLHLLRLPLQGVLIAWAWWYTRRDPPSVNAPPGAR